MQKISLTYSLASENYLEASDIQYNLFRKKTTYIKAAVFAIPLLLFIQQIFLDPYYIIGWLCIAICIAAVAAILNSPKLEKANAQHAAYILKDRQLHLEIDDSKLILSKIIPEGSEARICAVDLQEKGVKTLETEKIIGVFTKNESVVVPKEKLSVYEIEALRDVLKIKEI